MKNFQMFESTPPAAPLAAAGATRRPKGYGCSATRALTPAGGGCGCGKGRARWRREAAPRAARCPRPDDGRAGAEARGGGAHAPVGARRHPSGKMGEAFRALQSLTAGLLDQINVADRRAKRLSAAPGRRPAPASGARWWCHRRKPPN